MFKFKMKCTEFTVSWEVLFEGAYGGLYLEPIMCMRGSEYFSEFFGVDADTFMHQALTLEHAEYKKTGFDKGITYYLSGSGNGCLPIRYKSLVEAWLLYLEVQTGLDVVKYKANHNRAA